MKSIIVPRPGVQPDPQPAPDHLGQVGRCLRSQGGGPRWSAQVHQAGRLARQPLRLRLPHEELRPVVEPDRDQLDEQGRDALLRRGARLQCRQEDQERGQVRLPGEGARGHVRVSPRGDEHPAHHPHHPHRLPPGRRPLDQQDHREGQDAAAVEELTEPHAVHNHREARGGAPGGLSLGVGQRFHILTFCKKIFCILTVSSFFSGARFLETQIQVDSLSGTTSPAAP